MTDVRVDLGDLQFHGNPAEFDVQCGVYCTKKQAHRKYLEYDGPLKVLLLETPPVIYREQLWGNAFIKVSYVAMGAAISLVVFYALFNKKQNLGEKLHIALCTLGYQVCLPIAFFLTNPIDPRAVWMNSTQRIVESLVVRLIGAALIFSSIGYYLGLEVIDALDKRPKESEIEPLNLFLKLLKFYPVHSYFGVFAVIASAFELLFICCAFHITASKVWKLFSISALIFGSLAFCTGLLHSKVSSYIVVSNPSYAHICTGLCLVYTLTAIFRPLMDCLFERAED